jgi:hypothetical protein
VRRWLALAASLALAAPATARAEDSKSFEEKKKIPVRKATFESYKEWATVTVGWRDVINADIQKKLLSGLPTTISTRAYIFHDNAPGHPISLSVKTCRVVYDLWDEVFRIELHQAGHKLSTVAVNVEGVMRRCTEAKRLPIAAIKSLDATEPYFVGVLVEVNPLSKEMLERIKRWVSRPKGAGAVGPGDSLFGSFVGLFITHVPAADRVLLFRTPPFVVSKLPVVKEKKDEKKDKRA